MAWKSLNAKFYLHHTINDYDKNKTAISKFWHRVNDNKVADLVYYVGSNADVVKNSGGTYSEIEPGTLYWTMINNEIIFLGNAKTINATSGLVTFSYTANGTYYANATEVYKA